MLKAGKRGGQPTIRGLRITVYAILGYLAGGMTESEIVRDFPDLEIADIRAALAYAVEREREDHARQCVRLFLDENLSHRLVES